MQQMLLGLGAASTYEVERSLRFNKPDEPYLTRSVSSTGNQKVWTFSAWIKRTVIDDNAHYIYSANDGNAAYFALYFQYSELYTYFDPGNNYGTINSRRFRDVGAWFHLVHQVDAVNTTQKVWINGEELTLNSSRNPGNSNYPINQSGITQYLGTASWWTSQATHLYMAEIHFSDGNKYTPSDFAETDSKTGQWVPKKANITYGTNGYYLNFSDNSGTTSTTLGKDSSGNSNNFTSTNISVSSGLGNDSMKDTPTNNFGTFNSTFELASSASYANGSLEFSTSSTGQKLARSTFAHNSGKWYAEFRLDSYSSASGSYPYIGVTPANVADPYNDHNTWVGYIGTAINSAGTAYKDGSTISGGFSYAAGDIIGVAMDVDNLLVYFYKNGTIQNSGSGYALTSNIEKGYQFAVSFYANSGTWAANFGGIGIGSNSDANGHGNFTYSVPSGYLAECSANLPEPSIALPNKHFDTTLYTGNDSSQSISTLNFQPDLLWFKTTSHSAGHALYDSIRGVNLGMSPNTTAAEISADATDDLVSFDNDGFTLGPYEDLSSVNGSGREIVNWAWKGGGSAVTNNDGDISSQVSVNTTAGFSIVSYTGNGVNNSNVSIGHGLGVIPDLVIVKNRDSAKEWVVWHQNIGTDSTYVYQNLALNTTGADSANSDQFRNVDANTIQVRSPDSSNGKVNKSGDDYIAYVFTGIEGYSKFGSYEGNGSADGTFVFLGFSPAFLICKKISGTGNWGINDIKRDNNTEYGNDASVFANTNGTETTSSSLNVDFLSNGFKLRSTNSSYNGNGGKYIYLAFAESPLKYSRAL